MPSFFEEHAQRILVIVTHYDRCENPKSEELCSVIAEYIDCYRVIFSGLCNGTVLFGKRRLTNADLGR